MKCLVWEKGFLEKENPEEDFMQFCKVNILLYYTMNSSAKISVDSLRVRYVCGVDRVLALTHVTVRAKAAPREATTSG